MMEMENDKIPIDLCRVLTFENELFDDLKAYHATQIDVEH
jgi:hypothetical protein